MWIVYIGNKKHSIWNTRQEAMHQLNVCKEHGMTRAWDNSHIEQIDANYENGHYFV